MSDKFHEQPDNRHQPRGGSSPREKRPLNCEMNSTSTRSSPKGRPKTSSGPDSASQGADSGGHISHTRSQRLAIAGHPPALCLRGRSAPRPRTPPSLSLPSKAAHPAPAHCGPSTVPRGPAGAGELPTPQEGRCPRRARAFPAPPGNSGPHPHRLQPGARGGGPQARLRGGIQG